MRKKINLSGIGVGEISSPDIDGSIAQLMARHPDHNNAPNSPSSGIQVFINGNAALKGCRERADWIVLTL